MKTSHPFHHALANERGVSAVIVALVLLVLLGFAAFAIDIGYLYATKNELQDIADAGALAGANEIGNRFLNGEVLDEDTLTAAVKGVAQDVASDNEAAGKYDIDILDDEIILGTWDPDADPRFTPGFPSDGGWPSAVKVIARRDESANNPVTTFFAKLFNIDSADVVADATASLLGEATAEPGDLELPVGISEYWFEEDNWAPDRFCDQPIKFSPTGGLEGCAGWNNYDESPASDSQVRGKLDGLTDGSYEPPGATANETFFEFIGGDLSNPTFASLQALFESRRVGPILDDAGEEIPLYYDVDNNMVVWGEGADEHQPLLDADGNQKVLYEWETSVVVYQEERDEDGNYVNPCGNPQNALLVVGFATAIVQAVNGPACSPPQAHKTIFATVLCDQVNYGRGSGSGNFGTIGSLSGLVE